MIIGFVFGIPISIWAIYFLVARPLLDLAGRADPKSKIGQGLQVVGWLLIALLILIVLSIVMAVVVVLQLPEGQL